MHFPIHLPHIIVARGRPVIVPVEIQDASVRAKQVDLTEFGLSFRNHRSDRRLVSHIQRVTRAIQFRGQLSRRFAIEIGDHQTADTLLAKPPTQARTDSTGTTCDNNNLVAKLHDQAAYAVSM